MSAEIKVLLIDDDDLFRESLSRNLEDAGFLVVGFPGGPPLLEYLNDGKEGDVILLDWKMPDMNGIEVLRHLRQRGLNIPVIFLTVLNDQIYEEAALLGGAVDFIEKSRSFSILLKRLQLILGGRKTGRAREQEESQKEAPGNGILRLGHLELRTESGRALWRGERLDFTLTEFNMVRLLAESAGRDVRYRELYDLVHGDSFIAGQGEDGYRANVRTFIKRIRQKFRESDDGFTCIENYPGFGYRWNEEGAGENA